MIFPMIYIFNTVSVSNILTIGLLTNPDANYVGLDCNQQIDVGESTKWPYWFFYPNYDKTLGSAVVSLIGHNFINPSAPDDKI